MSEKIGNPFKIPTDKQIIDQRLSKLNRIKVKPERIPLSRRSISEGRKNSVSKRVILQRLSNVDLNQVKDIKNEDIDTINDDNLSLPSESTGEKAFRKSFPLKNKDFKSLALRRESLHEFISKKREILMLELVMQSKRDEIKNLQKLTIQRDKELDNFEAKLEKDAVHFDNHLKENDKKTQNAIKEAEAESKGKQLKFEVLSNLKLSITSLEAEISRLEQEKINSERHKAFLSSFQKVKENGDKKDIKFLLPEDLLDIFATLEEDTLFQLKNLQDTEHEFQTLEEKVKLSSLEYNTTIDNLTILYEQLKQKLNISKSESLTQSVEDKKEDNNQYYNNQHRELKVALFELEKIVIVVHKEVGLSKGQAEDITEDVEAVSVVGLVLPLLKEIVGLAEQKLNKLNSFDPLLVIEQEKKREKERREAVRLHKIKEHEALVEAKLKARLEQAKEDSRRKAAGEVLYKKTKPLMYRTFLPSSKKDKMKRRNSKEEQKHENHSTNLKDVEQMLSLH